MTYYSINFVDKYGINDEKNPASLPANGYRVSERYGQVEPLGWVVQDVDGTGPTLADEVNQFIIDYNGVIPLKKKLKSDLKNIASMKTFEAYNEDDSIDDLSEFSDPEALKKALSISGVLIMFIVKDIDRSYQGDGNMANKLAKFHLVFDAFKEKRTEINALTTESELNAYDMDSGWPDLS